METRKSAKNNSIRRMLLLAPILGSIALSASSDVSRTAVKETAAPYGVTSYMAQGENKTGNNSVDLDATPTYEWFC
jgi:hypothetical protein